jgi:hypothetical protein
MEHVKPGQRDSCPTEHKRRSGRPIAIFLTAALVLAAATLWGGLWYVLATAGNLGLSPLHAAVWNEDEASVRTLLAGDRAAVNSPAGRTWGGQLDGATPLMLAAARGNEKLITALLNAGADPTLTDAYGRNAADYAQMHEGNRKTLPPRD